MQQGFSGIIGILTIGAIGAIVFTLVSHPDGVKALFDGVDRALQSSYAAALGKTA